VGRHSGNHSGVLCEIRFRPKNGKNGGQGSAKSFLATLKKASHQEAQKHCHGGQVISVRKKQSKY
jgi:hypothetical protein